MNLECNTNLSHSDWSGAKLIPKLVIPNGAKRSDRSGEPALSLSKGTCCSLQLHWLTVSISLAEYRGRAAHQRRVSLTK